MLRILWGYANRHLLPLPLITFPTSARGLATPSNSAKPLFGRAPRSGLSRSNLVLSPLLIQKGLQQLAQAGYLSYKKLTQLSIPQFLGISLKNLGSLSTWRLYFVLFSTNIVLYLSMCMTVHTCVCHSLYVEVRGHLWELVLFYHVGSRD